MRPTYHLLPATTWEAIRLDDAPYAAPSLAVEGFVHCTDGADELVATANRYYREDQQPYVVLTIDLDAAGAPWTIEDPEGIYPHVHGAIARTAIVRVRPMLRDDEGTFLRIA